MKIDYKKELESASKSMIMIHDPKLLIKLIVRMIVHKVHIKHAGMLLYEPKKDAYILSISRGEMGIKVPEGFARFPKDNALIKIFVDRQHKYLIQDRQALLAEDINKLIWKESVIEGGNGTKKLLQEVSEHMPTH